MAVGARRRRARVGRTPGSPPNREAILAAAKAYFEGHGFERSTIRGIANEADVDPALLYHYFGSKDRLLVAALELPVNPREVVAEILAGGLDGVGERLLRRLLGVWGADWAAGGPMIGLIRAAATNEVATGLAREFFSREAVGRLAEALEMPQPRLRAALVGSQLMGLAMARFIVQMEPIASADPELLIACYAPTIQRYLTGPLPNDNRTPRPRKKRETGASGRRP